MEFTLLVFSTPEAERILTPTLGGWSEAHPAPKSQQALPSVLPADPNTLFRSNSLASKSMEQFMKVSGPRPGGPWGQLLRGVPLPGLTQTPELGWLRVALGG